MGNYIERNIVSATSIWVGNSEMRAQAFFIGNDKSRMMVEVTELAHGATSKLRSTMVARDVVKAHTTGHIGKACVLSDNEIRKSGHKLDGTSRQIRVRRMVYSFLTHGNDGK